MTDIQQELEQNGYVMIDDLGLDQPNEMLRQTMEQISEPVAYLGLPMVMDLRPQPGYQSASYAGTGTFNVHTDLQWHENPPKYIGMFCVQMESAGGGIPILADGYQALEHLSEEDIAYLKQETVTFTPPSHIDHPPLHAPILTEKNGRLVVRFRYDMLDDPTPPIDRYFEAINKCVFEVHPEPGSIWIVDNERILHGRTELQGGMDSDRLLKRMYGQV